MRINKGGDHLVINHGGDLEGYRLEYNCEPLDFSSNCNPLGVPKSVRLAIRDAANFVDIYPDPLSRRLTEALAKHLGLHSRFILSGNGSAELIYRLALAKKPRTAMVTAPTFSEYESALSVVGANVNHYVLKPENGFMLTEHILEKITEGLDLLFLCNPNNPTGLTIDHSLLCRILDACTAAGTLLVVDECFNGFLDEPAKHTMKGKISANKNLVILDAFTKLYGMAGVRLGYCVSSDEELLDTMRKSGQSWPVSTIAQSAGIAALRSRNTYRIPASLFKKLRCCCN